MKYYLIHYDPDRIDFMKNQFTKYNINNDDITWMSHPNYDELTDILIDEIYDKNRLSYTKNSLYADSYKNIDHKIMPKGAISCSYKHYLCMKDIVNKSLQYAVIMEDNIEFKKDVESTLESYLNELPEDWDIMFEGDICNLHADIVNDKNIYRMNETRGLNFYLLSQNGAKKLIKKIIPFSLNLDNFINLLIYEKEINLVLYWGEIGLVNKINRESTWKTN